MGPNYIEHDVGTPQFIKAPASLCSLASGACPYSEALRPEQAKSNLRVGDLGLIFKVLVGVVRHIFLWLKRDSIGLYGDNIRFYWLFGDVIGILLGQIRI